ncbi:MAG: N-formylglutamate amidohydrolase [Sphingomonadales bacterium]|nr:N-formylglutamate amidohydrolase [Sphingomonadales bacterium]
MRAPVNIFQCLADEFKPMSQIMTSASFDVFGSLVPVSPVILSVPHAGRDYPDLSGLVRHPIDRLRALEDRHVDRVAETAIATGIGAIISRMPRLWIDLNRAESDLDPAMVTGQHGGGAPSTARMRGGLGLIPRRLGELGDIWRGGMAQDDVGRRIDGHYRPYHAALSAMLSRAHDRFGVAMLVDLHSMPPLVGPDKPVIVLGDRFEATCAPRLSAVAATVFAGGGYDVGMNDPYAGGHIVSRHADRSRNIHALQVEVDRSLYLDDAFDRTGAGLPALQAVIAQLVDTLAAILTSPMQIAAE